MAGIHEHILKIHIPNSQRRNYTVRADTSDSRRWLSAAPACEHLAEFNIAHCGIMHSTYPMKVMRPELYGAFFLACRSGSGEVLIDGQWRDIGEGEACLQPPFISNGLRAKPGKPWSFCWVRYRDLTRNPPISSSDAPTMGTFDSNGLRAALQGLFAEVSGRAAPTALSHWAALVHGYVSSFAQPIQESVRLRKVWSEVHKHLDQPWDLDRLADLACVSKEHLRRLTLQALGRSPMQHVTYLRMTRAAEELDGTNEKIAHIARQVGYATPFAFSNTFLRWSGYRPSDYRTRFDS
jgi:AraC-like DNA-binding protein